MGNNKRASIPGKGFFEDFSGVDSGLANRASKQLLTLNEMQSGVQVKTKKNFMGKATYFGLQKLPHMAG
jgi:hypothetical protein